jgi:hypothetical protein
VKGSARLGADLAAKSFGTWASKTFYFIIFNLIGPLSNCKCTTGIKGLR